MQTVSGVDRFVGMLRQKLAERRMADNTVLIFTSEHGIRVDDFALGVDIAPTILEIAGIRPAPGMQGKSLFPLMLGEPVKWRTEFGNATGDWSESGGESPLLNLMIGRYEGCSGTERNMWNGTGELTLCRQQAYNFINNENFIQ